MARPVYGFDPPQPVTLLASAAHTATSSSQWYDGIPSQYRGVLIVLDVTAATTGTVTLTVETDDGAGIDDALVSSAITNVGTTMLLLHPSAPTDRANAVEKTPLLYKWRVEAAKSDATAKTYSIQAYFLP
jgi:hypothetical protein